MPKAYSYLRFSSPQQADGTSVERQVNKARAYAKAHGFELVEELQDPGLSAHSGAHIKKGQLGRFIKLIRAGSIEPGSLLIVEDLDRLSRENSFDALSRFIEILRADVHIVTLSGKEAVTLNAQEARKSSAVLNQVLGKIERAHDESEMKSERLRAAWELKRKHARDSGVKMTKWAPAWLRLSPDRRAYETIPKRVEVVQRVFDWCIGGIGVETIVRRLNAGKSKTPAWDVQGQGVVRSKRKIARGWHTSRVKRILDNPATFGCFQPYKTGANGRREPDGPPLLNYYPAIIREEVFQLAKEARQRRRHVGSGRKSREFSNLFQGLLRCGHCKGPMHLHDHGKRRPGTKHAGRYLRCDSVRRSSGCTARTIYRYSQVLEEDIVINIGDADMAALVGEERETHERLRRERIALEMKLKQAREEQRRVALIYAKKPEVDDVLGKLIEEFRDNVAALTKDQKRIDTEIAAINARAQMRDVADLINNRLARLREINQKPDVRKRYEARAAFAQYLRSFLSRVEFYPDHLDVVLINGIVSEVAFASRDLPATDEFEAEGAGAGAAEDLARPESS